MSRSEVQISETHVWVNGSHERDVQASGNFQIVLSGNAHFCSPTASTNLWIPPWFFEMPTSQIKQDAIMRFSTAFPLGFQVDRGSDFGFLSGFYAIKNSLHNQFANLPQPEMDSLRQLRRESAISATFEEAREQDDWCNYSFEALAAIFKIWCQIQGVDLRLGYLPLNGTPKLSETHDNDNTQVLWIFNDGHSLFEDQSKVLWGPKSGLRHWSALTPRPAHCTGLMGTKQIARGPIYDVPAAGKKWIRGPYWQLPSDSAGLYILGPGGEVVEETQEQQPPEGAAETQSEVVEAVKQQQPNYFAAQTQGMISQGKTYHGKGELKSKRKPDKNGPKEHSKTTQPGKLKAPANAPDEANLRQNILPKNKVATRTRSNNSQAIQNQLQDLVKLRYRKRRFRASKRLQHGISVTDRAEEHIVTTTNSKSTSSTLSFSENFVRLSPREVFSHLIATMRKHSWSRYEDLLDKDDEKLFEALRSYFTNEAWALLESGDYTRESLLSLKFEQPQAGLYLHVLWKTSDDAEFWLYGGQSQDMPNRIKNHQDPKYRRLNPSLHYAMWEYTLANYDAAKTDCFVYLGDFNNKSKIAPPVLETFNLLEQWMCLMLQTLRRRTLETFLPAENISPLSGRHLNIAPPLMQSEGNASLSREQVLEDIYHDSDPIVQGTFELMRKDFRSLKDSPNLAEKEYYHRRVQAGIEKQIITNNSKWRNEFSTGKYVNVLMHRDGLPFIHVQNHVIIISPEFASVSEGTRIWVKCELAEPGKEHFRFYARCAGYRDPARRLGIFVKGLDIHGNLFQEYCTSLGLKKHYRSRTLVDFLEGWDYRYSIKQPGRYINPTFSKRHPELIPLGGLINGLYTPDSMPAPTNDTDSNGDVIFGDALAFEETLDQCYDTELGSEISDHMKDREEEDGTENIHFAHTDIG